jgi:GNAT superfamily N-acetyltransferase
MMRNASYVCPFSRVTFSQAATRPYSVHFKPRLEFVGCHIAFREGWIVQFYVLPQRQRRGAGGALLQIAKASWSVLSLWTFQRNAAARLFYEKRGFVAVEETDGGRNEEREPDVLYRWRAG